MFELVTDGGALLLAVTLATTAAARKSVWAQKKPARQNAERASKS
ncbi:hypothetical protein [Lentzea sp. NPDC003310]